MSVMTPEMAAFCSGGVSIVIGVVGADGRAVASRADGCLVDPDGQVRLLFCRQGNADLMAAIALGGPIAATFSEPRSNRSLQLKGERLDPTPIGPEELAALGRQVQVFSRSLQEIGYSRAFGDAYCAIESSDVLGCAFRPTAAFEQTPGPTAGTAL